MGIVWRCKMDKYSFTIIATDDESNIQRGFPSLSDAKQKILLSPELFAENLKSFLDNFSKVLEKQPKTIGNGFAIDEIELTLAISASGGIELIGKAEVGMQSAITIKLKKAE
jgi:hypothetical protein